MAFQLDSVAVYMFALCRMVQSGLWHRLARMCLLATHVLTSCVMSEGFFPLASIRKL